MTNTLDTRDVFIAEPYNPDGEALYFYTQAEFAYKSEDNFNLYDIKPLISEYKFFNDTQNKPATFEEIPPC